MDVTPQEAAKLKANHVISEYTEWVNAPDDLNAPEILDGYDNTSNAGKGSHNFKYKKLTENEVRQFKSEGKIPNNANGVFYILNSVLDANNNNANIKANNVEIYQLKQKPTYEALGNGDVGFKYYLEQPKGFAGSGETSTQRNKVQKWW